jgi:hypothetical protein
VGQYIDLRRTEKYKKFIEDPWIDAGASINMPEPNDGHCKVLVLGAGFGGILYAVRLIQAGMNKDDIVIVDPAGGFGGTCKSLNSLRLALRITMRQGYSC